ncbi:MAG: hypothetical protein KKC68_00680 [Candidatus Thermoplasmatota archaeon]|nr:hypothetical protein [Candidatus Thermoplasmatota archaeon]MBU1940266.1 hypothetical protein [Candidatus Thermoplasmatota archaeon]
MNQSIIKYGIGIIILLLITSSCTTALTHTTTQITTQTTTISFSSPILKTNHDFTILTIPECTNTLTITGAPALPYQTLTYEFPLGTTISAITIETSDITITTITDPIIPAPQPLPTYDAPTTHYLQPNTQIYTTDTLFPETWYSYHLTGGLNRNNEHVTILTLQLYPLRYNPVQHSIHSIESITLDITATPPTTPFPCQDTYDLLIITYDRFATYLQPLVEHKIQHNLSTHLVTLSEIYQSTYFPVTGRDKQEQIKYFIKNAIEAWGITYVLLVGNYRKMPVRYTQLETDTGGTYEELEFCSDLYYADIYDATGNFSSWDTDNDENYGEWPYPESQPMEDQVDLRPDVHLGRLACMFGFEVWVTVRKIIDYEENAHASNWFNTMVVIGGDTFDKKWEDGTDYNEGEEATEKALEFMPEFTPVRLYTTLDTISKANMTTSISDGCGFLYFVGHGNPSFWATHYNGDYKNWTQGFGNKDILKLSHKGMYPILMVGGCHNSQFDVTPLNILLKGEEAFYYSIHVIECWSWMFVKRFNGGTIASIGSSGYGGVNIGDHNTNGIPDCVEGADGWFETQFFRIYNEEHIDILGETYSQVCSDYIDNFSVYTDRYDAKIVETHVLFGDPTLKIGGYP